MPNGEQQSLTKGRIMSIDALRGFDMFWIIGGAAIFRAPAEVWENPLTRIVQQQLRHVEWEGFHLTTAGG